MTGVTAAEAGVLSHPELQPMQEPPIWPFDPFDHFDTQNLGSAPKMPTAFRSRLKHLGSCAGIFGPMALEVIAINHTYLSLASRIFLLFQCQVFFCGNEIWFGSEFKLCFYNISDCDRY